MRGQKPSLKPSQKPCWFVTLVFDLRVEIWRLARRAGADAGYWSTDLRNHAGALRLVMARSPLVLGFAWLAFLGTLATLMLAIRMLALRTNM